MAINRAGHTQHGFGCVGDAAQAPWQQRHHSALHLHQDTRPPSSSTERPLSTPSPLRWACSVTQTNQEIPLAGSAALWRLKNSNPEQENSQEAENDVWLTLPTSSSPPRAAQQKPSVRGNERLRNRGKSLEKL